MVLSIVKFKAEFDRVILDLNKLFLDKKITHDLFMEKMSKLRSKWHLIPKREIDDDKFFLD